MGAHHEPRDQCLRTLVLINSAIFIFFAFSFFKPQTSRDWRTFGAFSAFIVALFVEMYGFPLTIYLLSGWLQTKYPGLDILSHEAGHLWATLLGEKGDPHFGVLHIASYRKPGMCCTTRSAVTALPQRGLMPVYGIRNMLHLC
jgi:hypothetical protein